MKILITGGAGFIGSNLALELESQNHQVTVIDSLSSSKKYNLNGFKGRMIEGDVASANSLSGDYEIIFHQAAITDPRHEDDKETYSKNLKGFENVIELANKNKAKLIYASTAGLYGNGPVPMKEDQEKELLSAYAKSKLKMDEMAENLFKEMCIIGLRYFNVFGPREKHKGRAASMIYHLRKQMLKGQKPRLFMTGEQKRDHIYVKDVVRATLLTLEAPSGIYNIGTGMATSFNDLVKILNEVLGTDLEIEYFNNPYQGTYQNNTQADTTKAEKILGFKAEFSLKEGIIDYHNFLKEDGK